MVDEVMRKKIIDLFEYRRLPVLMVYGCGVLETDFYEELIQLQWDIYRLDSILESSWHTDEIALAASWESIYESLRKLGVEESKILAYCHEIKTYEKHELALRDQKFPHDLDMDYFYYYKSCDVKLIRKLIYDRYPILASVVSLDDWKVFDYITEVNDDIEDLQEDMDTINGNSYLISKLIKGNQKTNHDFKGFIEDMASKNVNDTKYPDAISPYRMTLDILPATLALLEAQAEVDAFPSLFWKQIS